MSKWSGCPVISCQNSLCDKACQHEVGRLTAERDLWKARAFAMFWRLPKDTKIGDLQDETEKAKVFLIG